MIVLDTNVISELTRSRETRSAAAVAWLERQPLDALWVTSVTYAELLAGVYAMPSGRRKELTLQATRDVIMIDLDGRILPFGAEAVSAFAQISSERRAKGLSRTTADLQIAAIALSKGFAVATRNVSDFGAEGLTVINPWDHPAP
ncbi:type II toxin-antitoxin system VapC family toxin [Methylopila turkensis]|uniref:Ribonuclease VapC n=1 Tax=Methylopila turkensis TaxID=1437816 RepID=A0A9W6N6Q0_9HYPH|nr:type II toxin-antitoxin system VapC family toxin [Methylopila turkensis]GLK79542.1 ribonuclease VapC [Methylopila turkensis]